MPISSATPINGLMEGFYWTTSNAVNGHHGFYTKKQRDQLISVINGIINYYFYCPQNDEFDSFTMNIWNLQEISDWSDTISKASNVCIVMGLRPGLIDAVQISLQLIQTKLAQLASIGIRYYILCWDDVPGAGTTEQMILQRDLVHALIHQTTNMELIGLIPTYYAQSQVTDTNWTDELSILNQIPNYIRFFVTGSCIVPLSIQISDIPSLPNRQFIFVDNWTAVDTNSRITMTWPPNRHPNIYKASESISGSVLNLTFPPERILHQIYALTQRIYNKYSNINAFQAAEFWAIYLVKNNFYRWSSFEQLKDTLHSLIEHGYETNSEILHYYPFLQRIFTN